jgi:SWI/SNF-related matrix-associated actin-dependent regulator 1 of chromatin subfamily A
LWTGTADDELWPLIQSKLDVLNKVGLSKDNFQVKLLNIKIIVYIDLSEKLFVLQKISFSALFSLF